MEIARRLKFVADTKHIDDQSTVVAKLLNGLIRSLNQRSES
jgi:hypothetical protein